MTNSKAYLKKHKILKDFINEILAGLSVSSAEGPDRALGNIYRGQTRTAQSSKGILDDLEDEENWSDDFVN
jgi:hypothetical protein